MQRWRELLFCFVVATAAAWATTLLREPLGRFFAEEYLELASVLHLTGSFESVLRPPGYVAFLALVAFPNPSLFTGDFLTVFLLQGVFHGVTTAIIREEIGWSTSGNGPRLVALTFGLSPVALIGAAYLRYDTVHVFLLILTVAAGRRALASDSRLRDPLLAGAIAAVLALVRPMTLPWPIMLVGLVFLFCKGSRRVFALKAALILLSFTLTLTPYAVHNFQKTGRFILVNAQTGAALWPMTEAELSPNSRIFGWLRIWPDLGKPLLAAHAPDLLEDGDPFQTQPLATNDFLIERSRENFASAPMRYTRNVGRNAWFFLVGNQGTLVQIFRLTQGSGELTLHPARRFCVAAHEVGIVVVGMVGLVLCLIHKRNACLAAGSLLLCLWLVHSALYLDFRYLYVRTPLCILITGIALFAPDAGKSPWLRKAIAVVPGILFTSSLVAFVATFF